MKFTTKLTYTSREDRMNFVHDKYKPLFKKSLLDVGADECKIMALLDEGVEYKGIGLGSDNPNLIQVNLETDKVPLEDNSYETVMCLDVLEHLENIHEVFDELCRVSNKHVLISLPNPYADFMHYFKNGRYYENKDMKFYGLTPERESDRHKWFYSPADAMEFVNYRAEKAGFKVVDFQANRSSFFGKRWKAKVRKFMFNKLFKGNVDVSNFEYSTMWWVLEKK